MKPLLTKFLATCMAAVCLASTAAADYTVSASGDWPKSWPAELEPLRQQARTLEGPMILYLHHAITFKDRAEFEAAWPHLLKVKPPGAPILLRRAPSFWLAADAKQEKPTAGICIHTPPAGEKPTTDPKQAAARHEKSIYLELIVDGNIIDLNRIQLPRDTPIIDERFDDKAKR